MPRKPAQERRAERLRPDQLRKLREKAPLAYLPMGVLEWHGPQNPVGLDGVKAHLLCIQAARKSGGVVFPTLWYGPPPAASHLETDHLEPAFYKTYGLPKQNFTTNRFGFDTRLGQWELFNRTLDLALREIMRYGFEAIVVLAGHYPLVDSVSVTDAIEREYGVPLCLSHEGRLATPPDGDHAAQWETSLMLALEPDVVDTSLFPKKGKPNPPGVHGKPVSEVTEELARKNLKRAVDGLVKTGKSLLARRKACRKRWLKGKKT